MDEELETLRRKVEADPTDEESARRYDAALLRAGKGDALLERFRVKYLCPLEWSALSWTREPGVKYCGKCSRDVHFVSSSALMKEHLAAGHCVAFFKRNSKRFFKKMLGDVRLDSSELPDAPCVVERAPEPRRQVTMGIIRIPRAEQEEILRIVRERSERRERR